MLSNLTDIGHIIQNATFFNPRNWGNAVMDSDALLQAVQNLFALLKQRRVDYVLVGGIALLNYVEGRNTQDINLIMALDDLEGLPEIQTTTHDRFFAEATSRAYKSTSCSQLIPSFKRFSRTIQLP